MPHIAAKVGVVGAGSVGSAVANALALLRRCATVVLYDRRLERAQGEAWDIDDGLPLLHELDVVATGDLADLGVADVIIVTSGVKQEPGESRLALLARNAAVIGDLVRDLDRVAPEAIVIVLSNPVDVATRIAREASTRPPNRILGTGTLLDTSRLRYQLARALHVDDEDVQVWVLGEHGDTSVPVWSGAAVGSIPLDDYPLPGHQTLAEMKAETFRVVRERAYAILERKGFTNFGVAIAAARLTASILNDEKKVFTVSTRAPAEYGIGNDVVLGLPCVVGAGGIERVLTVLRDSEEQRLLEASAAALLRAYAALRPAPPSIARP